MFDVDWSSVFVPQQPALEILVRGTVVYLGLLMLLRVLRHEAGTLELPDLLLVVLLADATQNAMSGSYTSITDGLALVAVIALWAHLLNILSYRFRWVERLVRGTPTVLVDRGRMQRRGLRHALVSDEELWSELREKGITKLEQVERVLMEADGTITVMRRDQAADGH